MFKLLVCLCVLYICLVYSNEVYILVQCVMILVLMYVLLYTGMFVYAVCMCLVMSCL